jgi:ParB-like chromosome segregation protein Spo0J
MASEIRAGGDSKRTDMHLVDPTKVIVKEELRGRSKPPLEHQIQDMALSFYDHGQRQPVECRKMPNDTLSLVLGFTRTAAARLLRNGFTHPESGELIKDEEFLLKVLVTSSNDKEAFIRNIVENAHRNQTSPIDDANNQERLRDKYGKTCEEIARLYNKSENQIVRYQKLLQLPDKAQDLVHYGKLAVQAALDILDIDDDIQRNQAFIHVYEKCQSNGRIVAAEVRSVVRDIINDDHRDPNDLPEKKRKPKTLSRSRKEVKSFFEDLRDNHENQHLKNLADSMVHFMAGKLSVEELSEQFDLILDI